MPDLGDQIRAARKRRGYSQRALADLVGCSHAMVGHIERGGAPSLDTLGRIASALGLQLVVEAVDPSGPDRLAVLPVSVAQLADDIVALDEDQRRAVARLVGLFPNLPPARAAFLVEQVAILDEAHGRPAEVGAQGGQYRLKGEQPL